MRSHAIIHIALFLGIMTLGSPLAAQPTPTTSFGISQRILAPELPYNGPQYGWAVAEHDGVLAVGAPNISASRGAVYLFHRDTSGRWAYAQTLTRAGNEATGAKLGDAVTFHQGKLIVSASRHKGVNGQLGPGKVFIYERLVDGGWVASGELPRPADDAVAGFGASLTSDGERLIVGAPNGPGRALVYTQDAQGAWQQQQEIKPPQAEEATRFGWALASSAGLVAITAPGYNMNEGKGHLFKFDGQEYKPLPSITSPVTLKHGFGERVTFAQDRIFISTRTVDAAGAVYAYEHTDGEQLTLRQSLTPQSSTFGDNFGSGMAASSQWLAIASTGIKSQTSLWRRGDDGLYKEELNLYTQTGLPLGGPTNGNPSASGFGQALVWSEDKLLVGSPFSSLSGEVFEFAQQRWMTREQNAPTLTDEAFGQAIVPDRDQLLVGTPGKNNGNLTNAGGAYLFTRTPAEATGWSAPLPIFNGGSPPEVRAGQTVAMDGALLALGSPTAKQGQGQVDIYQRDPNGVWTLKDSIQGEPRERLGSALVFHQGQLLVGAPEYKNPQQEAIRFHGLVRIYKIEQGNATLVDVLALPGRTRVGESLAQDGIRLIVGAPGIDDASPSSVIVYEFDGAYSRQAELRGQEGAGSFGRAVAISGTSLLVGQPGFLKTGSVEAAPRCEGRGLAYSFDLSRPNPESTRALIEPPSNQADTCFGLRLELSKGRAFVSAPGHDEQGQLFIFSQDQGQWRLDQALENPTRVNQGGFARDFAVVDDAIFISAPNQQGGALYTFELQAELTSPAPNSTQTEQRVVFSGLSSPGMTVTLTLVDGPDVGSSSSIEVGSSVSWQLPLTLQDGAHTARLRFEHISGLTVSDLEVKFSVNSALPSSPQITAPGQYSNSAKPLFEGTAVAELKVELTLKDAQQATVAAQEVTASAQGQWSWSPTMSFTDGQYTLEARTINSVGLKSEVTRLEFTIDTIAPIRPTIDDIDSSSNPPKLSGSAEAGTMLTMLINLGDQRVMLPVDQSGRWELSAPEALDDTQPHRVEVFSVDEAGNSSERVERAFSFAGVEIRASPNNTPALNGESEIEQIIDVRVTLTREDDADFIRTYEAKTNAQGRWSLQIEEPLAPGVYTVLVEYLGTEQFELYKLRIPYVPDDFKRSYCMMSRQAPRSPGPGALGLIFALLSLGWARARTREARRA